MTIQMKIFTQHKIALIGILVSLLTCTKDSLFDPSDTKSVTCYAFLSDTLISNITIQDTSKLSTIDTIHTANSAVFVGLVVPVDGNIKRAYWEFGDNQTSSEKILMHKYAKSGVYTAVFTIEDEAEFTMKDTVVVHVNTPPSVDTLLLPYNGQTGIDPTDPRGIYFSWSYSEQDSGDSVLIDLYISGDTTFLQPSVSNIDTNFYDYKGSIDILKTYFWRIVISDRYKDSDTSDIYRFSTKDPNAVDGILKGYALFEGWTNHAGIKITITASGEERTAITTNTGYFEILNVIQKPLYTIIAEDVVKTEFISDTVFHPINVGEITIADTMILKDIFKPVILETNPIDTQTIRQPQVSVSYSDVASGILASSVVITVNDSDFTNEAIVTQTGVTWTPAQRLPDGDYTVRVTVSDSAGNEADPKEWTFTVDAMKLFAMQDTTVRINGTVNMHGRVSNAYSKVVEYRWDFDGDSTWDDTIASNDTTISTPHVFTHEDTYYSVLCAIDDSGMVKYDTVKVIVTNTGATTIVTGDTTISIKDQVTLIGSAHDSDGTIKEYAWDAEGDGTFEFVSGTDSVTVHTYNTAGVYNAIFRVKDDDDKVKRDTVIITVLLDVPIPNAGEDTTLSINDFIRLHGVASDSFGTIMKWEWDFGNTGTFISTSTSDTNITAPATENLNYQCVLKVTDDDGNEAKDTVIITVLQDKPVPNAGQDTTVSINDLIRLHGSASDSFGTIVSWAWDLGNTGVFISTSTFDTNIIAPASEDLNSQCVLKATDDDGNVAFDTVVISVLQDAPTAEAGNDTVIAFGSTINLHGTAFDNYGSIIKWEWKIGDNPWVETSSGDTNFIPPRVAKMFLCSLRVTDDDGEIGVDFVNIDVQVIFTTHTITGSANGAISVFAIDLDGDEDIDVLSASEVDRKITWYENDGAENFTDHTITTSADSATSVFAIDVDGDGDIDVLSASYGDAKIAWYENDGAENFTAHTITTSAYGAESVFAIDIDGDGDIDVLSASYYDDKIAWYENDGAENFTAYTITTSADYAYSVFAIDVNGDGDIDVLSASAGDAKIAWYENDGAENFTHHLIITPAYDPVSVFAIDVDEDGDIDVLSASINDDQIAWYENDGDENFTAHTITDSAALAYSVFAIDVNGDGDIDVLSASYGDDKIAWYENDGEENFTAHKITTSAIYAHSVFAIDVDSDGDIDVLSASRDDDKIAWYENGD